MLHKKSSEQPVIYWHKAFLYKLGNGIVKMTQIPSENVKKMNKYRNVGIFSNLEEPLDEPCGTLGFRGTPVEKHCIRWFD